MAKMNMIAALNSALDLQLVERSTNRLPEPPEFGDHSSLINIRE